MSAASHTTAPLPANEAERLQTLASYGILDTPYEADFDDIARIAAHICNAPIAVVNLIDEGRQWFKSEVGLGMRETPIGSSICAHAILQPYLLEVPDTMLDSRFESNPLVTGDPYLRFYAGAPLSTPDGYQLGTVCVLDHQPRQLDARQRDALVALSRQTMALMELRRTLREAQLTQKNLRRLMATAGHDLRQPLQTISLSLEIARQRTNDLATVKQIKLGLAATSRLGEDLDELARASSQATAHLQPELTAVAVQARFDGLQRLWGAEAARKGLKLRFAPCSARVFSNARMFDAILGNLLGNAIKYTASGGVLVGCRRAGGQLRVEVLDTGIGVSPELQSEVFEAFRKVDMRSEGLGLGLSIVRNTAQLLGAPVELHSIFGRGTRVGVTLPLAE